MSFGRLSALALSISLCVALLATLFPEAALAAPPGKQREYIVTLAVTGSGRTIEPSSQTNRARIRQRTIRADEVTDRVAREHGVRAHHRYGNAFTGFSTTMTPAQAAAVASDPSVSGVRLARTFKLAAQDIPVGIKRVKAWTTGQTPGSDVDANVAIIDTGVGPATGNGTPIDMLDQPPQGAPELNIRGGVNCFDDPATKDVDEHTLYPDRWGDTYGHGTHVAGIIGARDNGVGTIGVAPGVKLWSLRVFQGSYGSEAAVVCALDWAIATHSNATPDIDVINMSLEGPRMDLREDCGTVLADPDGDPMQKSICNATAIGITVVAAAGNSDDNANLIAPGGFDQVITVGALSDFDGEGWGTGPNGQCSDYRREVDDTYARYSNHGPDVDIVAPGTCVASTWYGDPKGDAKVTLTGTSMAAPHVTGAVARYLAKPGNAGTSASDMRKLVRASGRMDWDARSDPFWLGVNDDDPPNRVLDVKALTGGDLVRAWAYHREFNVAGADKARSTRVDIQRGGGYAGTVNLSLAGLPSAVGTSSFADNSLDGLAPKALGTKLSLNLKTGGPDGIYGLDVQANGAGVSPHSRPISLTVDREGPLVSDLSPRLRGDLASLTTSGAAQTYLQWIVSDEVSGVRFAKLQRKTGTQSWRNAGVGGSTKARVTLKPGQANKFRVKATDNLGNTRTSGVISARLSVRDFKSTLWQKPVGGAWKTKPVSQAFGGSILLANGGTGSLKTSFRGKALAVVGSVGPGRGTFRVRIDSGQWQTVSLKSKKAGHRKVVWSRRLDPGSHDVEIQGSSGQTAFDALLIIR